MFIHNVYFWLKPDRTPEQQAQFDAGVQSLLTIESVQQGFIGTPASTDRPVIDRSYHCALIVQFADKAAHDAYQDHPVHDAFRDECGVLFDRVQIYDAVD